MPGDKDVSDHRGQLPPFSPPKFNWNQDILYKKFKSFKRFVEFVFQRQYEKCFNGIKCGSILNWLGVEAYPTYDNLFISEEDKKDPTKLLDAFEFKPERNIFQSWYALGSIYGGAFKTHSEFYHKLNCVANNSNFTNKDDIVKFLYLTHNQNTKVHEHLSKELTDKISLADMLKMARVCEDTVHYEKISEQYLESVKTVKQVDAIHQRNSSKPKHKGRGCGGHSSHNRSQSRKHGRYSIVDPVTHPRSARPMARNVFTATKKDILASFGIQNNMASHLDQMLEAHLKTTDFHTEMYRRSTNVNLMTLSSLSKTQ